MVPVPASDLDALTAMGFHPEAARAALRSANLDRALAVERGAASCLEPARRERLLMTTITCFS